MKAKPIAWFAFAICIAAGYVWLGARAPTQQAARPTCPATDSALLRLPADHQPQAQAFAAKAQRLSASGLCVIEGSWGVNYQRYYFAVYDLGAGPKRPYFVRFTADELTK